MVTLAASAYFLSCCRPIYSSSFCYYVETPRLINSFHYPFKSLINSQYSDCSSHDKLSDHNVITFNTCTDVRAWTNDHEQRRLHFLDATCGRVQLCSPGDYSGLGEKEIKPLRQARAGRIESKRDKLEEATENKLEPETYCQYEFPMLKDECRNLFKDNVEEEESDTLEEGILETRAQVVEEEIPEPLEAGLVETETLDVEEEIPKVYEKEFAENKTQDIDDDKKEKSSEGDLCVLTDGIIDKLETNLGNLEETFDKFIKKNRNFIQNLVELLNFEKQKQKALEDEYNNLKQENYVLQTRKEYLEMVNTKQLELFKNELDRGISENKAIYTKKIHKMEIQLQTEKDEVKYYKQSERKYLGVVKNECMEVDRLNNQICDLKNKEAMLLKNYVEILNFLKDVKETLSNNIATKELCRRCDYSITTEA